MAGNPLVGVDLAGRAARAACRTASSLEFDALFGRSGYVELSGPAIARRDSERLLEELARLQAVAAGVAFGLQADLTFRRDRDFDSAGHDDPSRVTNWQSRQLG